MTGVRGDQHLVIGLTGQQQLAVRQRAVFEGGVDEDLVLAVRQRLGLTVWQAEPPGAPVVGGAVRDHVGQVGQRVQPLAQLGQRKAGVHRLAVVDDVQAVVGELDDLLAAGPLDPRLADVPFLRHGPVQHLRAGGHLYELQLGDLGKNAQGLAQPVAGDAARDRVQPRQVRVDLGQQRVAVQRCAQLHPVS